jgi:hypothetical protein
MVQKKRLTTKEILEKYGNRIEGQIDTDSSVASSDYSSSYVKFKEEMAPQINRYERWCKSLGSIVKINVSKADEERIRKDIETAHLNVLPWQAMTLSIMSFLVVFFIGLLGSISALLITGNFPFLFFILLIFASLFLFYFMQAYPKRLANQWRLKASSQMVPAILYVVVYMRHTSNLEKAIAFASEHLEFPLALDFKKVFYNVQIGNFSTIKESLDNYLDGWRGYSTEFIEAFHLIESSLFEPNETRRISTLEKSLQVVLDGVYEKMLKFSHNVRSPLTNVYMLGVVLPTLALALVPLASAMIGEFFRWYHLVVLFNVIVPFLVFYLTDRIMFLRPGGYGETNLLEKNPLYAKYKDNSVYFRAFLITLPLILLGLIPLFAGYTPILEWVGLSKGVSFADLGLSFLGDGPLFDFKVIDGKTLGPFGVGAALFSMFIPLGIALFFSIAYKNKTGELIIEREKTKSLESEFNNSLFQLGNRLGNGVPPELAFGKVAESSKGLNTEDFFRKVHYNIHQMGMSVEKAIFDKKRGAIIYYPSNLISTSMRVLVESSKKGLKVAAMSLMSISEYVKNIQKITSRLRDLLAEVVSDMKSNMTFLAPLLSGVVVGLAVMITSILNKLDVSSFQELGASGAGNFGTFLEIFQVSQMIPPYFLQISVGIYLIQIIFILTGTLVVIDSGQDKLERTNKTGGNLLRGMVLYFVIAFFSTLVLFFLTAIVLAGI